MKEFIFLMHNDVPAERAAKGDEGWPAYLQGLSASGRFDGGSVIGDGVSLRKDGSPGAITAQLGGYLRIRAASLEEAQRFLPGNPVFEGGGTVEIRELPPS